MKLGTSALTASTTFSPQTELKNMTDSKLELIGTVPVVSKSSYEDAEGNVTVFNRTYDAKPIVALETDGSDNAAILAHASAGTDATINFVPTRLTEARIAGNVA